MQCNTVTKKIDHSCGCVELLNGNMFYSPNPPKNGGSVVLSQHYYPKHHIFTLHGSKPDIQQCDLLLLHWYAPRTAFLSFLMLNPITMGYSFNQLAHIPAQDHTDDGYILKEKAQDSWCKLEQDLLLITAHLWIAFQLKLFVDCPFAPRAFSFYCSSPTHRIMKKRAGLS